MNELGPPAVTQIVKLFSDRFRTILNDALARLNLYNSKTTLTNGFDNSAAIAIGKLKNFERASTFVWHP